MKRFVFFYLLFALFCAGPAGAVSHLDVDFSSYLLGDVKGQSGGTGGAWTGGVAWSGQVVPFAGHSAGVQGLEVYRTAGSSAGRGSVALSGALPLVSDEKIYISVDVYAKENSGTLEMTLSNGSVGGIPNRGFSLFWDTTGKAVSFSSSTEGGILTRTEGSLVPEAGVWYRFEFEINQSDTSGKGTFSVFVSTREDARTAIVSDQPYTFTETVFPTFNVVPNLNGDESNAVAINNIVIQSGVDDFPKNPLSIRRLQLMLITARLGLTEPTRILK